MSPERKCASEQPGQIQETGLYLENVPVIPLLEALKWNWCSGFCGREAMGLSNSWLLASHRQKGLTGCRGTRLHRS